jgi:hypothetical protein
MVLRMLRPSNSLLGSSLAARRSAFRAQSMKFFHQAYRRIRSLIAGLFGTAVDLVLLCGLPILYLASAYLVLDLPARWLTHRGAHGNWGALLFAGAAIVCLTGISRAMQDAPPIAPVRPRFAKTMFGLSWVAALLLLIGDLAS